MAFDEVAGAIADRVDQKEDGDAKKG